MLQPQTAPQACHRARARLKPEPGLPAGPICSLQWSCDSALLAVVQPGCLQLWQRSNWHWYRKWERCWAAAEPCCVRWDAQLPGRLYLAQGSQLHQVLLFGGCPSENQRV